MQVNYQIVSFHKPTSSIQVKYFNEDLPNGVMFSLNLPVIGGQLPQGQALEDFVLRHVPLDMFERAAASRGTPTPAELEALPSPSQVAPDGFLEGQMFVREGGERIFMVRPLLHIHAMDIPIEVI